MDNGTYISIVCKNDEAADINFTALYDALPGVGLVNDLPGNELLIHCESKEQGYPLSKIRETLKRPARIDMFELATDERTGEQYRNWYYLPPKKSRRKTA